MYLYVIPNFDGKFRPVSTFALDVVDGAHDEIEESATSMNGIHFFNSLKSSYKLK